VVTSRSLWFQSDLFLYLPPVDSRFGGLLTTGIDYLGFGCRIYVEVSGGDQPFIRFHSAICFGCHRLRADSVDCSPLALVISDSRELLSKTLSTRPTVNEHCALFRASGGQPSPYSK